MDTGMLWLNILEGAALGATVVGAAYFIGGAVSRMAGSVDHLAQRVDAIAAALQSYVQTQGLHGERIAKLESWREEEAR